MFCPFLGVAKPQQEIGLTSEHDCLKDSCAWWSKDTNQCDPTGLLTWLKNIEGYLEQILHGKPD